MEVLIDVIIEYVKKFFEKDYSGHDFYHTFRVYKMAEIISRSEDCDVEIVCVSALLHDIDDYKIVGEQEYPLKNAKSLLENLNYSNEKIAKICHIISQVSFKGKDTIIPDTIEGKIVQDADRLDAIGAIGIARTFSYGGNHKIPIYNPENDHKNINYLENDYKVSTTTINHFYDKLLNLKQLMNTDTAKEIAELRHQYMINFLEEFYNEWNMVL